MASIRTLRIQLTEKCNLNCLFCCNEGTKCDFNIIKDENLIKLIRACYDTIGIQRVKFTGGEPLIHDGSILGIMKKLNNLKIDWSIVTNATDLQKMKKLLKEENLDVTISLPVPFDSTSEDYWKITHGNKDQSNQLFKNVKETINWAIENDRTIKINYVLCKGYNDSEEQIKRMVSFAQKHRCIDLRFLETVTNNTNNEDYRMRKYCVTEEDFITRIKRIYSDIIIDNSRRSHTRIVLSDKTSFRLVKFFCNDNCFECPEDKTSLWLTPSGTIKKCSFRIEAEKIENWSYSELTHLFEKIKGLD